MGTGNSLVPVGTSESAAKPLVEISAASDLVSFLGSNSVFEEYPPNTRRRYIASLRYIWGWYDIALRTKMPLPAEENDILRFIKDHLPSKNGPPALSGSKVTRLVEKGFRRSETPLAASTVQSHLAAWRVLHSLVGLEGKFAHVAIRRALNNRLASAPPKRGKSLNMITSAMVLQMRDQCPDTIRGKRDRALLSFIFASGGRRRSEIRTLRLRDLHPVHAAYHKDNEDAAPEFVVDLTQTKTGNGRVSLKGIAASDMQDWLKAARIIRKTAPVFPRIRRGDVVDHTADVGMSGQAVSEVIKSLIKDAGYDPEQFSPHGLRSGFIYHCLGQNMDLVSVAQGTLHKSFDSLKTYVDSNVRPHMSVDPLATR